MANILKLGSLYLDDRPVEIGGNYSPDQIIMLGETIPGKEASWVVVNGMLIANRCMLVNIRWDDLAEQGLVFGKEITVQGFGFKIRLLKVGNKDRVPNEWDAALDAVGESDALWHWSGRYFWGQESVSGFESSRAFRGHSLARFFTWDSPSLRRPKIGFRPILKPLHTNPSDLRPGKDVMAIGRDGYVIGRLVDKTQYDLILRPKAGVAAGVPSFAANMQDGTLAVDRSGILLALP